GIVTHGHGDHFDGNLINNICTDDSIVVVPNSLKDKIASGKIWTISPGEKRVTDDGILVRATVAYNVKRFRSSGEPYHPRELGLGYVIEVDEKKVYDAGDTDLIPEMEELPELDAALLPSGGTYTMDMNEAAEAAFLIQPKVAIPMHLRGADPQAFKNDVENKSSTTVVILEEGEEYKLE
ncbi:MAG: MBL fold metallo-hydrolase, partial [Candidatus Thorarchaeota archaeon]|nr:MBL fold metallo-hydrolase [Candidatus Thorarchaeota archaeon]